MCYFLRYVLGVKTVLAFAFMEYYSLDSYDVAKYNLSLGPRTGQGRKEARRTGRDTEKWFKVNEDPIPPSLKCSKNKHVSSESRTSSEL